MPVRPPTGDGGPSYSHGMGTHPSPNESDPARNRVSPFGDLLAVAGRGAWMGNRGRLHDGTGTRDVVRHHALKAWITCRLEFRGRTVAQWDPGHYTPLFFLDEAVALAAGHRPCAECRHADYTSYQQAWASAAGTDRPYAAAMDARLHGERWRRGGPRPIHEVAWADLPDGVFVVQDDGAWVVHGDHLTRWEAGSNTYGRKAPRPGSGSATALTPPATIAVLRAGYAVQVDPAAIR